jgi:hypothetical protein
VDVEINQQNAMDLINLYFFTMATTCFGKRCHPQGATMSLSEPLQRQYGWHRFAETCRSHSKKKNKEV